MREKLRSVRSLPALKSMTYVIFAKILVFALFTWLWIKSWSKIRVIFSRTWLQDWNCLCFWNIAYQHSRNFLHIFESRFLSANKFYFLFTRNDNAEVPKVFFLFFFYLFLHRQEVGSMINTGSFRRSYVTCFELLFTLHRFCFEKYDLYLIKYE